MLTVSAHTETFLTSLLAEFSGSVSPWHSRDHPVRAGLRLAGALATLSRSKVALNFDY